MLKKELFKNTRLMFVSPWLFAASIGLLVLIIVVLATSNFQKVKLLVTDGLFHKGQMAIRFVGAGMRASLTMGGGTSQTQHLMEQASQEKEILYIIILNTDGEILAHSDPSMIGKPISRDLDLIRDIKPTGKWHIVSYPKAPQKAFEVISHFDPFRHGGGRGRFMKRRHMMHMMSQGQNKNDNANDWGIQFWNKDQDQQASSHIILVGLDMYDLDNIIQQHRYNIIIMSVVLLLVGLGGWISLLATQSYKASQEALSHVQAFTGLLISRLPVGIIATNQQNQIKTFNSAAATMTNTKNSNDVINQTPTKALPTLIADFFNTSPANEEILDQEVVFTPSNDKPLTLHISSVPILDQQGVSTGRVLLMYDLTKLKNLEREMKRHDQLIALGKMAAGVAHEVRNPLSSIKGFASLLGSHFSKESKEQEAAGLLINEVERLNRSITELLNYARPLPLNVTKLDLKNLIPASLKLIASDAEELKINITTEIDPDASLVTADSDRLNQVLLNLYLNAIQAMSNGGTLNVSTKKTAQQGIVDIEIKDSGIGISEDSLKRILDPYFTTKPEGTGLGLAMVNKILDEHGGSIHFASKVGKGTTVKISLPAGV